MQPAPRKRVCVTARVIRLRRLRSRRADRRGRSPGASFFRPHNMVVAGDTAGESSIEALGGQGDGVLPRLPSRYIPPFKRGIKGDFSRRFTIATVRAFPGGGEDEGGSPERPPWRPFWPKVCVGVIGDEGLSVEVEEFKPGSSRGLEVPWSVAEGKGNRSLSDLCLDVLSPHASRLSVSF